MIHEQALVLSVEPGFALLEARRKSACNSCRAKPGCGQAVLARLSPREPTVRALLPDDMAGKVSAGSLVTVAIPANAVVLGSLLLYAVPVVGLLLGAVLGARWFEDGMTAMLPAVLGLLVGGWLVRIISRRIDDHPDFQPLIVDCDSALAAGCSTVTVVDNL